MIAQDEELKIIKNCQAGQMGDFTVLYDEYINKIYRFIFYKIQHKETAEDITSSVFIKALENITKFNPDKASFSVWIYSIARNSAIDYFRTKKTTVDIDDIFDLPAEELNIGDRIDVQAKIKNIQLYLERLNPEQKELVVLRVWEGLSYKEIAEIMGKTENSSKVMFSRVMAELRKEFGPMAIIIMFMAM